MSDATHETQAPPPTWSLPARLIVGLVQGGLFYALDQARDSGWSKLHLGLYGAGFLVVAFVPLILLAGFGRLRRTSLAIWTCAATVVLAGLAFYGGTNIIPNQNGYSTADNPSFALLMAGAAALFVAHHLIEGGDTERRLVAPYRTYFDIAWKHAFQLGLSLAFIGVFWALLWLGAALFRLIGIEAFQDLLKQEWFHYPVLGVAFAGAVHLTDARAGLTRGARTLGLTLLSWLTPIMALIVVGFLAALPFTGLKPLWDTRSAAAVLLGASAVLIVLINAAYQDGDRERGPHLVLRWAVRAAALALAPLTLIAGYAVALRIGQHGLTPERVMAATLTFLSACYALGYGLAAVLPGPWMKPLERTNIACACVVLALVLAIFSPVADPARLSVDDQVARLTSGRTAPDKFDFDFLRFESGRYGLERLKRLKRLKGARDARIVRGADIALKRDTALPKQDAGYGLQEGVKRHIVVYPSGSALPAEFESQTHAVTHCISSCDAYLADLDGDGMQEVLLDGGVSVIHVYARDPEHGWVNVGRLVGSDCAGVTQALKAGHIATRPSRWPSVIAGGVELKFRSETDSACQVAPSKAATVER